MNVAENLAQRRMKTDEEEKEEQQQQHFYMRFIHFLQRKTSCGTNGGKKQTDNVKTQSYY